MLTTERMFDNLPDELILKIFLYLDKRDLAKCSLVCKRWNQLANTDALWRSFSLTEIRKPKWCAAKLIPMQHTNYLIEKRFSANISRVDLSKMFFSFDTLQTLFKHCVNIQSLVINFKYLQIRAPLSHLVDECITCLPSNKLTHLYLKNVCDMKTRRLKCATNSSYDIIEIEVIKFIKKLVESNEHSLKVLGLKCVDPNIISQCVNMFKNLEILLLNNVNDTDSVLQELAYVCENLKCLELNKCGEFQGDGLQEIIDQCDKLETLQLGKHIYPTISELNEINWTNLRYKLRQLAITTKFAANDASHQSQLNYLSNSPSSDHSSSSSITSSTDLYSSTIFNYLNDFNCLEYLALADFTLKFPADSRQEEKQQRVVERARSSRQLDEERSTNESILPNLKHLYLRNIRNVKVLSDYQLTSLSQFLKLQYNLQTLDLTGLYLKSNFICQLLVNLNNLKVFNFGHGKSYKKSTKKNPENNTIDIDAVNTVLAKHCVELTHLGIFFRQSELKYGKDKQIECRNEALIRLLQSCVHMKEISYLKSFKVQDDDDDEDDEDEPNHDDSDKQIETKSRPKRFKPNVQRLSSTSRRTCKKKNYFHFIKYAIENASVRSSHVNMRPCYGFDITPSSGHLLDTKVNSFIETTLPRIRPPRHDFHASIFN